MATPATQVQRQPDHPVTEPDFLNVTKGLKSWLITLDHKRIGMMYLYGILISLIVGGAFALLVRAELFLPGKQHEVYGYIEASMFDVKTGLLMFTTRRSIHATQTTNQWNKQLKLEKLAANATAKFAPDLAHDVQQDLRRFAAAAIAENTKRPRDGEIAVEVPPMPAEPVIATDPKPAAPIH